MAGLSDSDIGLSDEDIGLDAQPEAPTQTGPSPSTAQGLSDADIGLSDEDIGLGAQDQAQPQPRSALGTFGVRAAKSIIPTAAGFAAAAPAAEAGAALGATVGSALPVVGTAIGGAVGGLIGGAAGMFAGGYAGSKVQDAGLEAVGYDDSQQEAIDAQTHPWAAFAGDVAPSALAMSPAGGAKIAERALSGAGMAGFEAGQEEYNEGSIDPARVLAAGAFGATFARPNKIGEGLAAAGESAVGAAGRAARSMGKVAGRPNVDVNDDAARAMDEATSSQQATVTGESSLQQPAPSTDGSTTGNPQSAPVQDSGNDGRYHKGRPPRGGGNDPLTEGTYAPDVSAALTAAQNPDVEASLTAFRAAANGTAVPAGVDTARGTYEGERIPIQTGITEAAEGAPQAAPAQPQETAPAAPVQPEAPQAPAPVAPPQRQVQVVRKRSRKPAPETQAAAPEAPIQTGIEEAGPAPTPGKMEGGNEPTTGLSDADIGLEHPTNKIDREKVNTEPSDAQKEAGNYEKAPVRLLNREAKIETPEGATRRSKSTDAVQWENVSPYDYGHFLRTVGADGDPIDVAVGKGDKHFVIDQRDANTKKFDEHKVFAHFNDVRDAMSNYEKGFSDNKGGDRLQAITEASPADIRAWMDDLKKNPDKRKLPYSEYAGGVENKGPVEGAKPEPKAVTAAVSKMREAGVSEADIAKLKAMPIGEQIKAANRALRGKTTDVARPNRLRGNVPVVEGIKTDEGAPVTARDKGDAARKSADVKTMNDAYDKLGKVDIPNTPEEKAALRQRLQDFVDATKAVTYRPAFKHAPYVMARAAKKLLMAKNPTEKGWKSFVADALVPEETRATQRIEADIGRSRRTGDEAVANAEAKSAGTNDVEDAMIDKIDREKELEKKGAFDAVPAEEAPEHMTPIKSAEDVARVEKKPGAPLDLSKPADQKKLYEATERAKLASKMQAELKAKRAAPEAPSEEKAAGAVRKIDPKSLGADYMKDLLARAEKKPSGGRLDAAEIVEAARQAPPKSGVRDLADVFLRDHSGQLDINKVIADLKKLKGNVAHYFTPQPHESYIARTPKSRAERVNRSIADRLHQGNQADIQHSLDLMDFVKSLPPELNNPATMQRIYFTREAGKTNLLPANEQALYNRYLKPLYDQNDQLYQNIAAIDPKRLGPKVEGDHVYRIPARAMRKDTKLANSADPVQAIGTAAKGTMLPRRFVTLEDKAGNRFLVSPTDDGFTVWHNRKPINIADPTFNFVRGSTVDVGGRTFTMHDATTPEIEQHALFDDGKPAEYYHNAALSAAAANYTLGSIARHLQMLEEIKKDPLFLAHATPPGQKAPPHYVGTNLANFKDWKMNPQLAHALDDYAQAGFNEDSLNTLRKISQTITSTIFWNPVPHIANVGTHWVVGRGWQWLPMSGGYRSLAVDGMRAIKSVITQDDLQRELRLRGAGTIYGGIVSQGLMDNMAKGLGEAVRKNPSKWDPIARQFGMGPSDLARAVYKASSKVMWAANDMFLTHAVLENMGRGMEMQDAITHAERHIPNYRIPSTIMGSEKGARIFSQLMADPTFMVFGRYHYGVFNSYAHIAKDLIQGNGAAKVEAVGNLFALGMLALAVYPVMDKMAQMLTGNDKASQNRRGPLAVPTHAGGALGGKEPWSSALRSTLTVSPLITTAIDAFNNKDFRGKDIIERGDVQRAAQGNLHAAGNVAKQATGFLARSLIAPAGTAMAAASKGEGVASTLRDQYLDQKNPSAKSVKYDANSTRYNMQNARKREKSGELY